MIENIPNNLLNYIFFFFMSGSLILSGQPTQDKVKGNIYFTWGVPVVSDGFNADSYTSSGEFSGLVVVNSQLYMQLRIPFIFYRFNQTAVTAKGEKLYYHVSEATWGNPSINIGIHSNKSWNFKLAFSLPVMNKKNVNSMVLGSAMDIQNRSDFQPGWYALKLTPEYVFSFGDYNFKISAGSQIYFRKKATSAQDRFEIFEESGIELYKKIKGMTMVWRMQGTFWLSTPTLPFSARLLTQTAVSAKIYINRWNFSPFLRIPLSKNLRGIVRAIAGTGLTYNF